MILFVTNLMKSLVLKKKIFLKIKFIHTTLNEQNILFIIIFISYFRFHIYNRETKK